MQVHFAWETGRRLVQEEQNGAMRAKYGANLLPEVSKVLTKKYGPGFSVNVIRTMRQFYLRNPIQPVTVELDWTDHVELLPIKDEKTRKELEARILKEGLNSKELRQLVQEIRTSEINNKPQAIAAKILPPLKRPTELKLGTFSVSTLPVKSKAGWIVIDCGFFVNWWVKKEKLKTLNIVKEMSYTYAATIERVVDGDTLLVLIDVGFGIIVRERLRLRGINAAELDTPDGKKAKKFVEKLLPVQTAVVIQSHKSKTDIYGRFVVDVFFKSGVEDASAILADGVYLNQYLLDCGYAVRMAG